MAPRHPAQSPSPKVRSDDAEAVFEPHVRVKQALASQPLDSLPAAVAQLAVIVLAVLVAK